ncbi:hypothetical protein ALON55S_05429 [Alishewanella longhuensis]
MLTVTPQAGAGANFAEGYGWRYTVSEGKDFLPSLNLAYDITDGSLLGALAYPRPLPGRR